MRMTAPLPNCFSIWPIADVECLVPLHRRCLSLLSVTGAPY